MNGNAAVFHRTAIMYQNFHLSIFIVEKLQVRLINLLYLFEIYNILNCSHLDPGKNIDPLIKTAPESRIYQHLEYSPVL